MASAAPPPSTADLPHDSLQPNIIASIAVTWAIAAVFVALRFYTRGKIIGAIHASDWCILIALIFAFACSIAEGAEAVYGGGVHMWDLDPNNILKWALAGWVAILFYTLSFLFSKVSILLLYMSIFSLMWVRRAGQVILAIVIITHLYMIAAIFTACIPLQSFWDKSITSSYCHVQAVWWSNTGLLMVTDFLIFLLPMPVVFNLHVVRRQKWMLAGIFGVGFFVCFISIIRLLYLVPMENNPNPDFLYATAGLDYWTMIELHGAIVVACMITMKPLLNKLFPRLMEKSSSSRKQTSSDKWASPPTIGSLSSREALCERVDSRDKYKPSLQALREKMDDDGNGVDLEAASSGSRLTSSSDINHDAPFTTELNPPPLAKVWTSHHERIRSRS